MRCFVAIDIDEHIRRRICKLQDELRGRIGVQKSRIKWVQPEQIHLTLKFLGEVPDAAIAEVCRTVEKAVKIHSSFEINITGVGTFGRPAGVLWVGAEENASILALAADVEKACAAMGFEPEKRKFSAHLTIARIKDPAAGQLVVGEIDSVKNFSPGSMMIDLVKIYKSDLTSAGPQYTVLHKITLPT